MKLSNTQYQKIRNWMYRNARPLEFAIWQYQFENKNQQMILDILKSYQNPDGGFGHALEADSWNPNSSPIQTWTATQIIRNLEINANNEIIQGILNYLDSEMGFKDNRWLFTIITNNDYPHAPWWHVEKEDYNDYNPTASLVGFILKYATKESKLYKKALAIAKELCNLFSSIEKHDMHEVSSFALMIEDIKIAKLEHEFSYEQIKTDVSNKINDLLTHDQNNWHSYCSKPSDFIRDSKSLYYQQNQELLEKELDFIISNINQDGVWNIAWGWGMYEKEFAISENWWKASLVLKYTVLLRNFSHIEE